MGGMIHSQTPDTQSSVELPFTDRARRFGYVIWPKKREGEVIDLLQQTEEIVIEFNGNDLGAKRIDYKYCRISVGRSVMAGIADDASTMRLTREGSSLRVEVS